MRVSHLITGTHIGGAELALAQLLAHGGPGDEVICLKPLGEVAARIEDAGVVCWSLGIAHPKHLPRGWAKLRRHLRRRRVDVVVTWLYHANVLGLSAAWRLPTRVVWNLRSSHADESGTTDGRDVVQQLSGRLTTSPVGPDGILAVSHAAKEAHVAYGYAADDIVVVENGVDGQRFAPDAKRRQQARRAWAVDDDTVVIGHVGRASPMKDHATLFAAFDQLRASTTTPVQLVCVGAGVPALSSSAPTGTVLLPAHPSIEDVVVGFDVGVMSSARAEGFPNAVSEAMATALPVVATDVGDARRMLDDDRFVVSAQDASALASALLDVVDLDAEARHQLGRRNRERILSTFSTSRMVERYWSAVRAVHGRR